MELWYYAVQPLSLPTSVDDVTVRFIIWPGDAMQREIRLTPILLLVLGLTTVLVVGLILLLWTLLPSSLQSGLPFAISTVVIVNTALLRVIPVVGKRLSGGDSASSALAKAQLDAFAQKAKDVVGQAARIVAPITAANGHTIYRARFGLYAEREARDVCNKLTQRGHTCFAVVNR